MITNAQIWKLRQISRELMEAQRNTDWARGIQERMKTALLDKKDMEEVSQYVFGITESDDPKAGAKAWSVINAYVNGGLVKVVREIHDLLVIKWTLEHNKIDPKNISKTLAIH